MKNINEQYPDSTQNDITSPDSISELRLLAPTHADHILGVRLGTVKSLVEDGKLGAVYLNDRMKIPYFELKRFLVENLETNLQPKTNIKLSPLHSKARHNSSLFNTREIAKNIIGDKNGNSN